MLIVVGPVEAETHVRHAHPERPARIGAAMDGVHDLRLGSDLVVLPARPAAMSDVARVHTTEYLDHLRRFCAAGAGPLDADTYATPDRGTRR